MTRKQKLENYNNYLKRSNTIWDHPVHCTENEKASAFFTASHVFHESEAKNVTLGFTAPNVLIIHVTLSLTK